VTLALRVSGESGGYWLARSQVDEFGFVAQPQAGGQPGTLVEFNERGNSQRTVASLLVHHSPAHQPAEAAGAGPPQRGVLAAGRAAACAWGQPPGAAVTALDHQLAAGGTGQEFGASRVRPHHADALDAARLTRQCVGTGRLPGRRLRCLTHAGEIFSLVFRTCAGRRADRAGRRGSPLVRAEYQRPVVVEYPAIAADQDQVCGR